MSKKQRGRNRNGSLLAPLSDEEFRHLMRDIPPSTPSDSVTLRLCARCQLWRNAVLFTRCGLCDDCRPWRKR